MKPLRKRYALGMSVVIRQSELRNDNATVMRRVAEGESFVVTVNGRPVADVVPHRQDTGKRRFVAVTTLAEAFAAAPTVDPRAWRSDLATVEEIFGSDEPSDPFDLEGH
jgi:prevent-host-death family protein